jgi:hypothetical protein
MAFDPIAGVDLLFGGLDAQGNALGDTWAWDGVDWSKLG